MKTISVVLVLGLLAGAAHAAPRRVAVLPFIPEKGADPREGWRISAKLAAKLEGRAETTVLSWEELSRLMEESGLDKKRLRDPAVLREVGRRLGVDDVVAGTFSGLGRRDSAQARRLEVASGAVSESPRWTIDRDVLVAPPGLAVEPPVLDEDEPGMRDSVADDPCEGARDRVDAFEESILDLKARYWALQLQRGMGMSAVKFNPGSTITEPELKAKFYRRIKEWMKEDVVPELSPSELKEFAEADEQAAALARRCRFL